jgi:DNA polymerase I-like protein with 3'-5' exonuclease and polymerase domains
MVLTFVSNENGATVVTTDGIRFAYFEKLPKELLCNPDFKKQTHSSYRAYLLCPDAENIVFDTELAAYLLDVLSEKYPITQLSELYLDKAISSEDEKLRLESSIEAAIQMAENKKDSDIML